MKTYTALLAVARAVGETFEGVATGGSTTQLIDTTQKNSMDDYFTGGTLFFISGTNAETTKIITDYANAARCFYFDTTGNVVAGVRYAACRNTYNRGDLLRAVNQALGEIGELTQHDDTLDVIADTEEYTLPAGIRNVVKVEVGLDTTAPYGWMPYRYWMETNGSLIFAPGRAPATEDMPVRLWYNAQHALVNADTDVISDYINPLRLTWTAAYYAALNRARIVERDDPILLETLKMITARMVEMAAKYPIRNMHKQTRLSGWLL